jgi:hypothetical protein
METLGITSGMNFLENHELYETEKLYIMKYEPPEDFPRPNYRIELKEQFIQGIRGREEDFSMKQNGFAIVPLETKMSYKDFDDNAAI